jgi:hypothetical protein
MSERFSDAVLQRVLDAYVSNAKRSDADGKAAMRAILDEYLGKACTDNPLQNQLLDLITLMPDFQTQEIIDYIMDLRRIRAIHADGSQR